MEQNKNLLPISIIIAAIVIAGAIIYKPSAEKTQPVVGSVLDYVELAKTLGLDTVKFKTCVQTHKYKDEIAKDEKDGGAAGVNGTPSTFINGRMIEGADVYAKYKSAIEAALKNPAIPDGASNPSKDDDAVLGNPNASVGIIIFGDYQCPFCERAFQASEAQARKDYVDTGKAYMVFRDFPLSFHQAAQPAAEAAECAHEQGKYWEYHDELFKNQARLPLQ